MSSQTILHLLITYRYLILFPLAALEGPVVALLAGFMVSLGHFQVLPAYAILILGDLIPDSFYYYLGRFGNKKNLIEKYSVSSKLLSQNLALMKRLFREHGRKTLFFGKLAYGLSIPFLITAGIIQMSYGTFVSYALPATLFQYGLLMIAGYYLGNSYALAQTYIHDAGIAIAVLVALFFAAYIMLAAFARRKLESIEQEEFSTEHPHD